MLGVGKTGLCFTLLFAGVACTSSSDTPGMRSFDEELTPADGSEGDDEGEETVISPSAPPPEVLNPTNVDLARPTAPPTRMPATPPMVSELGGRCGDNAVCASGLRCFGATSSGVLEAVPGGYCSIPCSVNEDCASIGVGSSCYREQFCTLPCSPFADSDPGGSQKCGGRRGELDCFGFQFGEGSCLPSCESDEVCGPTRECYYGSGTCVLVGRSEVLFNEAPIGAQCEPDSFTCRGYCLGNGDGDPRDPADDSASLCSGVCSVGAERCGGDAGNICIPYFAGGRHGDRGNCYRQCQTSADCGLAGECVPSGVLTAAGEETGYCQSLRATVPTAAPARLSLADMQELGWATDISYIQSHDYGDVSSRLFVEGGEVCLAGEIADGPDANASAPHLSFQFGWVDPPTPHDVSAADALSITLSADRSVDIYATQVGRAPVEYGGFVLEAPLEPQTLRSAYSELAPDQIGAPPWDPALLDTVNVRLSSGAGPFRVCVSQLTFE